MMLFWLPILRVSADAAVWELGVASQWRPLEDQAAADPEAGGCFCRRRLAVLLGVGVLRLLFLLPILGVSAAAAVWELEVASQ